MRDKGKVFELKCMFGFVASYIVSRSCPNFSYHSDLEGEKA